MKHFENSPAERWQGVDGEASNREEFGSSLLRECYRQWWETEMIIASMRKWRTGCFPESSEERRERLDGETYRAI
jgi:hypothetical protein